MTSGEKWGYGLIAVLLCGQAALIVVGYKQTWPPSILIPTVGVVTFFGVLLAANLFSGDAALRKGEMRKAITASMLVVYFFFVSVILFASASPIYKLNQSGESTTPQADVTEEVFVPEIQGDIVPIALQTEATPEPQATETPEPSQVAEPAANDEADVPKTPIDLVYKVISNFTWLMGSVIAFYFGSRTIEDVQAARSGNDPQ